MARLYDIRPKKRSAYKKDYKDLAPRTKRRYRAAADPRPRIARIIDPIDRKPRAERIRLVGQYEGATSGTYGGEYQPPPYVPEARPPEPQIGGVQDAYYEDEVEDLEGELSEEESGGYYDEYYFDYPEEGIEGYEEKAA